MVLVKEIVPLDRERDQYKRASARLGLHFYIDKFGALVSYPEENRQATEPELQMWRLLAPKELSSCAYTSDVPTLDTLLSEFKACLIGSIPMTLNAYDVALLRQETFSTSGFVPCIEWALMRDGQIGTFQGCPLYVSRHIPRGYFWRGALKKWQPPEGAQVLDPGVDEHTLATIQAELEPFIS